MTAIRNVGELASPYFLLEVWVRREEIDIDPETFATLKRKARSLVRDARGFELRDDEPDDDWRLRRRELLALEELAALDEPGGDDRPFDLSVWRADKGADAVIVGDLPGFLDPDRRTPDDTDPPATVFELALDEYQGDADWGLLLAGLEIRVYRRSSGISQQYIAVDLDTLVELDDEASWKAFAAIFRSPAFAPDADNVPLVRRVVDESRRHASALAADMRRDVIDAAEAIIQGAINHPDNREVIGTPSRDRLHQLFEESLYYLYRVLFVMYAESRGVLPVSDQGPYATSYSVDHLVELARRGGAQPQGRYFDESLQTLFTLLWSGPPEVAGRLGFSPVGGELFDPAETRTLDACVIPDSAWERALSSIALGAPDSPRRRLGRRSSFAELGVDQLGSIYEGLLVLEPFLATEDAFFGTFKNERRVFSDSDIDGFKVQRHLHAGDFVLESAGGRRKGSGSFYTPHEITEYLTHAALDPLLEPIVERAKADPDQAADQLLQLKVCDPAMGSGAFLVQAARVLALALARVRAAKSDGLVTPDRVQHAKREVARHCLYGVDLNPLAVALAKVSLWLETLEPSRPLSFLDAHLRCGDSLVGVDFRDEQGDFSAAELATFPVNADKGLRAYLTKDAGGIGEATLDRLKARKRPKAAKQAQLPGIDRSQVEAGLEALAMERERIAELEERADTLFDAQEAQEAFEALEAAEDSVRNRLRRAADFWCAQWFSDGEDSPADDHGPAVPASAGDFELTMSAIVGNNPVPARCIGLAEAAERVAQRRRFFHWTLEFPEVFFERGGFDAVIGNPPWNTTTPDSKEYFGTFDPKTFAKRKGGSPQQQAEREAELRADPAIDAGWRSEARYLHELSNYAKPESGRFMWFAGDGQLRKGDANVFRLFVERAYRLCRDRGRMAQVLPDSFYLSSPATGLRRRLLDEAEIDFCWVFENRRAIFPIDTRSKITLLAITVGVGPTDAFRARFFVGKDPAGRSRCVGVEELPAVVAELADAPAALTRTQIDTLFPVTLAFPELQTALDAEIALKCATEQPALNLDERGWGLTYCSELHADKDSHLFRDAAFLQGQGAVRDGLMWRAPHGRSWWPLIEGSFYHLEYPAEGKTIKNWVAEEDLRGLDGRQNPDGTLVMEHPRMSWRDVTSATNERGAIACLLPPLTVAKHTNPTVWGGSQSLETMIALSALVSSLVFDYLVRFTGKIHLTYAAFNAVPAPPEASLEELLPAARVLYEAQLEYAPLLGTVAPLNASAAARKRGLLDAVIANAYGLSLEQYAAVTVSFPNLDKSQPMLPGEPKCFFTRDLALSAYCELTGIEKPDVAKLMREIDSGLPDPAAEYRGLDERIAGYEELGAVAYRPTPKGARVPIDPSVVENVKLELSDDPMTAAELAEAMGEEEDLVKKILKDLKKTKEVFSEGRGAKTRYYTIEDS